MFISMLMEKIQDYLHEKIKLSDFEKWFVPHLPSIFSQPQSFASDLAATIELGLAEINNNILSEEQFRNLIKDFLSVHQINIYDSYPESQLLNFTTFSSKGIILVSSDDYLATQVSLVL